MKLQSLRALVAIVDVGSFSGAALDLGVSQSGVSAAIAELETELGVRLLERGRSGAAPTEVGARIVSQARRLETVLAAIRQEAQLERGRLDGEIRVSAFRSSATHVLPRAIAALDALHPEVRVTVDELPTRCVDVTGPLHEGTVDLALTMSFLAENVVFWELLRDRYWAVVPSAQAVSELSLNGLLGFPLILSDGPCSLPVRRALLEIDPGFRPAHQISEDSTMLAMVAQGLGVAVMPELTIDALPAGVLRVALRETLERSVGVAFLPSALKTPAIRVFLSTLRDLFPAGEVPPLGDRVGAGAPRSHDPPPL